MMVEIPKAKEKPIPPMKAMWNMSELKIRRANHTLWEMEEYYKLISSGNPDEIKAHLIPFISCINCLNLGHVSAIGEDKELKEKTKQLREMAKKYLRVVRYVPNVPPKPEMMELIDYCIEKINLVIQQQGWGIAAELRQQEGEDEFFGI